MIELANALIYINKSMLVHVHPCCLGVSGWYIIVLGNIISRDNVILAIFSLLQCYIITLYSICSNPCVLLLHCS